LLDCPHEVLRYGFAEPSPLGAVSDLPAHGLTVGSITRLSHGLGNGLAIGGAATAAAGGGGGFEPHENDIIAAMIAMQILAILDSAKKGVRTLSFIASEYNQRVVAKGRFQHMIKPV
jgi:hypothetical protein